MGSAGRKPAPSMKGGIEPLSPHPATRPGLQGGRRPRLRGWAGRLVTRIPGRLSGTPRHVPHTCHTAPPTSAHLGERPGSPLTVAPVDATPPATSTRASRDQAQHEGCCLQSILGSKATVTPRPGPASLSADQGPLWGTALRTPPGSGPQGYLGSIGSGCPVARLGGLGE